MSFIIIFGLPSFPIRLINQRPQTKILTGLSKSRVHFTSRFSSSENYKLHLITDWLSVKTHHASTKRPPVTMTADSRIAIATTAARDVATNTSSLSLSYWWAGDRGITAEDMEKSQHTDFNEDTTDEGASVACSNIRLWKLDSQKEWRNTSGRLWDERT